MHNLVSRIDNKFKRWKLLNVTLNKPGINLGSGELYLQQFLNIDSDPKYNPDIQEEMMRFLEKLPSNSANSFLLLHVLPYFNYIEHRNILKYLAQSLNKGGKIYIEHPDINKIKNINSTSIKLDSLFATKNGKITHDKQYQCLIPFEDLKDMLLPLGFSVKINQPIFHGARNFRDSALLAKKNV